MTTYMEKNHIKQWIFLLIVLILISFLNFSFVEKNFIDNECTSRTIISENTSHEDQVFTLVRPQRNEKETVKAKVFIILWFSLYFYIFLSNKKFNAKFETNILTWLTNELKRLLLSKENKSNYKGFISAWINYQY